MLFTDGVKVTTREGEVSEYYSFRVLKQGTLANQWTVICW